MNNMPDNYIHIQITKGGVKDAVQQKELSFSPKYTSSNAISQNENQLENIRNDLLNLGLIQMGKSALSYTISNYGNLTGDYYTQERLMGATQLLGMGAMLASGTAGIIAVATDITLKVINRSIEIEKSRRVSKNLRARLGLTYGGSR